MTEQIQSLQLSISSVDVGGFARETVNCCLVKIEDYSTSLLLPILKVLLISVA